MFSDNSQKKCVTVHVNGVFDHGKIIYIEPEWLFLDLLSAASHRLEMVPAARRVFNANGVELDDCIMIEDDDILFFSNGDDFLAPTVESGAQYRIANGLEREKLPSVVGSYKVGKLLGRGAFGEVRVGEHQLTGDRVALKFLRKSEILSIGAAERTITEIQCLTALRHQNIIRLQQHLESPDHVILVFELMEGGDLRSFLHQRNTSSGSASLPEDEARMLFHQLVSGVSFAHNQHICHRDLKLENILLKGPTLAIVKIADFGLSAFYRPGAMIKSSCGTLSFLAPEVFNGTANAGPPLDVWSLGVILFAILCGRLPFEGNDLAGTKRPRDAVIRSRIIKCQYKIDEHLSAEAKDLVRRMLKLDPTERASIPEVLNHIWMRQSNAQHHLDLISPPLVHLFASAVGAPAPLVTSSVSSAAHPTTPTGSVAVKRDSRLFMLDDLATNLDSTAAETHTERGRGASVDFESSPSRRAILHSTSEKLRLEEGLDSFGAESQQPKALQKHLSWRSGGSLDLDDKVSPGSITNSPSGAGVAGIFNGKERDSFPSPLTETSTFYGIGGGRSRRGNSESLGSGSPMFPLSRDNSSGSGIGKPPGTVRGAWVRDNQSSFDSQSMEGVDSPSSGGSSWPGSSTLSGYHSRALSRGSSGDFTDEKKDVEANATERTSTFKLEPLRRGNIVIVDDDDSDNDDIPTTAMLASHLGPTNTTDSSGNQLQSSVTPTNSQSGSQGRQGRRHSRSPVTEVYNGTAGSNMSANNNSSIGGARSNSRPKTVTEGSRPRNRDKWILPSDSVDSPGDEIMTPPIASPMLSGGGGRRGGRRGINSANLSNGEQNRDSPTPSQIQGLSLRDRDLDEFGKVRDVLTSLTEREKDRSHIRDQVAGVTSSRRDANRLSGGSSSTLAKSSIGALGSTQSVAGATKGAPSVATTLSTATTTPKPRMGT